MSRFIQLLVACLILLLIGGRYIRTKFGFDATQPQIQSMKQTVESSKSTEVQVFATEAGWGYAIYHNGKPYIKQTTIPAIEGNKGFSSREKALKAAQLVAYKIEKSMLPPTVTRQELDSLQVLTE